jgi:hypothetical protein
MKSCACSARGRCAQWIVEVREERGAWNWNQERASRRTTLGIFSGCVSHDGVTVIPFTGPRPVSLDRPLEPGTEVSYALVRTDDGLVAERVKVAA